MSSDRFGGKVALVTAAGSGIGAAIVRRLCAEGAQVVAGDINEPLLADLAREFPDGLVAQRADVTNEDDLAGLVRLAVERFGGLDAAFNVAGGARPGLTAELTQEAWDYSINLSLKSVAFGMKHQLQQMVAQGRGGSIVNVASLNSKVPFRSMMPYCSAKAGVVMAGQVAALEYGEKGIRVNNLSPGITETPLTAPIRGIDGVTQAYLDRIPLNRLGRPEDIASAAAFLASDDAAYISGVNLVVDGGWELTGYPDLRSFMPSAAKK